MKKSNMKSKILSTIKGLVRGGYGEYAGCGMYNFELRSERLKEEGYHESIILQVYPQENESLYVLAYQEIEDDVYDNVSFDFDDLDEDTIIEIYDSIVDYAYFARL